MFPETIQRAAIGARLLGVVFGSMLVAPAFGQQATLKVSTPQADGKVIFWVYAPGYEEKRVEVDGITKPAGAGAAAARDAAKNKRDKIIAKLDGIRLQDIVGQDSPPLSAQAAEGVYGVRFSGLPKDFEIEFDMNGTKEKLDEIKVSKARNAKIIVTKPPNNLMESGSGSDMYAELTVGVITHAGGQFHRHFVTREFFDPGALNEYDVASMLLGELEPLLPSGIGVMQSGAALEFTADNARSGGHVFKGLIFGSDSDMMWVNARVHVLPTPGPAALFGLSALCAIRRRRG